MEEKELVQGLVEHRDDAVRLYLQRYRSLFHHCIGHFETDPASREDLYQDLVWYVLERLKKDSFDPTKGSFGTWLYRVAWCRCVDLKRQQNARRRLRIQGVGDELPDRPDPAPGPRELCGDAEIGQLVQGALAQLGQEDKQLLDLRYIDGLVLAQIAERLEISVEQAKYRLKRASSKLRRVLLQHVARQGTVD